MSTAVYILDAIAIVLLVIYLFRIKSKKKFKILVVDDDRGLLQLMKSDLLKSGFDVVTAVTGEAGLEIAKDLRPNLIILDVIMPGIKGREVCRRLKESELTRHIPVVFLTSKNSPDDIKAELDAGAVAHLTKPVSHQDLIAEINKILGLK